MASLSPLTAVAQEIKTTIDISYAYTHKTGAEEESTTRELNQKYELEYNTGLGFFDFSGKLSFGYDVSKSTEDVTTRKQNPSLDLKVAGQDMKISASYDGTKDFTGGTEDSGETTAYSSSYLIEAMAEPQRLPKTTLKLERKREFELQTVERVGTSLSLDMTYVAGNLDSEFKYQRTRDEDILPETYITTENGWEGKFGYGRKFSEHFDLQLEYDIKETVTEDLGRDRVFLSEGKEYTQQLKSGVKGNFNLLRDFQTSLAYDFDFEQDFMEEDYRYKISQKLTGDVKRDFLRWMSMNVKYEGSDNRTIGLDDEEDEEEVKNKISGSLRFKPYAWFDVETKGERELTATLEQDTGGTVEDSDKKKFETTLQANLTQAVKLTATQGYEEEEIDDLLSAKSTTFKAKALLSTWDFLKIEPSYEVSLDEDYETERSVSTFAGSTRTWDAQVKLAFDKTWLGILQFRAEHTYDYKKKQELDSVLNLEEQDEISEDSKVGLKVTGWIRGLTMEGEVSRKATDTKGDEEPMIIDRTLSLKLDWNIQDFTLSSSYKFDDKGDADDTLSFSTKVAWKREFYEITGEYQYDKTFSEEIEESMKYNLKLKVVF